jgi:cysteine desulfurase/selenocysteine lyase
MKEAITTFNVEAVRNQFPILQQKINGKKLIYLDNGASSQKPVKVIKAIEDYYSNINANVHRGVHTLSQKATDAFEESRNNVANFINAAESAEIIFTKGTTEGINLVANGFRHLIQMNDEILISAMEHHANIVPWQMICEEKKARLKIIPIDAEGNLLWNKNLLNSKTKIVAITHISNALGTINDVKQIIEDAHLHHIPVLVDGAQSIQHGPFDVQAIDADFFVFSGHKIFAPMGIGVLYGKRIWLEILAPYQGGGDMIKTVSFEKTTYNEIPFKFEAGTPNVEGAIGLSAAIDFLKQYDFEEIGQYENELLKYATHKMLDIDGLKVYGNASKKAPVISFNIGKIHPYDVGVILDQYGIAVRTGHHCTQPLMQFFEIPGTVRASFTFYNTIEEIDVMIDALHKAKKMLS